LSEWWIHEPLRIVIGFASFLMLFASHLSGHGLARLLFCGPILNRIGIVSYEWFLIHLAHPESPLPSSSAFG
jgi:hypothetical protein